MRRTAQARKERLRSDALLVRQTPYGEADLLLTFFTEARGIVTASARSGRRSARRFPALEPMHLLRIGLDERPGAEIGTLVESSILRPRMGLIADLGKLDAAGRALRWVRRAAPPHTPEPALWREVNALLDGLDDEGPGPPPTVRLAAMGLRLLGAVGWGLDLERCVRCGRTCDPGSSACLDAGQGGLVCRACGGARRLLRAEPRVRLLAASRGDEAALGPEDVEVALEIVEDALAAHA
jgi:DNA repair protein RecO (recombination protein O)